MSAILECRGLVKRYSGSFPALNGVNLTLERGKIIGLLGPNGSGKTTLLKLAAGLLVPTEGTLHVNDKTPGVESKLEVAYLPDANYLSDWMRVEQQVEYLADFFLNFNKKKAEEMLDRLGIDRKARLKTLSKGTREKVQLILTMSREADLYLLDEPIGGVDPAARDYILDTIISNYSENASVILSTHLIADVERVLDEVVFLYRGQLALHETVDHIREQQGKSVDALFREVYKC